MFDKKKDWVLVRNFLTHIYQSKNDSVSYIIYIQKVSIVYDFHLSLSKRQKGYSLLGMNVQSKNLF